ncbi:MAG TPA: c-type cytochrome [Gaiellaceae bacterium]|nr:c-type cytochrome [Gaiellaceae bacterium]
MPRPRRRNPWTSTGEVLIWVFFALLLFPIGFAGWAVGHYTSLGKSASVRTFTVGATTAGTTATPTTTAATTTAGTTTSGGGGGGGNAAAGQTVFASSGCATCHTFQPANATGTIGPDLDQAPAQDAKADHNMALAAFIKESIVNPDAYIAKGYHPGLMPKTFGSSLSKTQLNDLVAFILSGTKS